jgi:hypothetical protein
MRTSMNGAGDADANTYSDDDTLLTILAKKQRAGPFEGTFPPPKPPPLRINKCLI